MQREQYLQVPIVEDFIDWLSQRLADQVACRHSYVDRRSGKHWQFAGLEDACDQYQWPLGNGQGSADLKANAKVLGALSAALAQHVTSGDDSAACTAACEVMKWGGVSNGNVSWLKANEAGLAKLLRQITTTLNNGDPGALPANLRFNAGMTKVYSLLAKDFIIYDSRVAAALGWLVVKFCEERQFAAVPAELAFPWAPSKEARTAQQPKNRNPGKGTLAFPRLRFGTHHAVWNLKASWVLKAALLRDTASQFAQPGEVDSLRRLEAALFMFGYDLPHAAR